MDRVQFDRVSKRYVLGERMNAREALAAAAKGIVVRRRQERPVLWSLRDVSFSVDDGEALGIMGRNGAGKSTILKILAGITSPTSGVSRTRGRVAALLEVGTGFHPELTGRENVFVNGAILGMSRRDIVSRFDRIVDFAGTERFLDTPIKRYSSGMQLRLAFAVAAHLEPDVLVVDEVLAVGDAEFQRKCVGRMAEAETEGRTVVFVSHDLETLSRLCRRSLWLDAGRIRDVGPTSEVVRAYLGSRPLAAETGNALLHGGPVAIRDLRVTAEHGSDSALLRGDAVKLQVDLKVNEDVPGLDLALMLTTRAGVRVFDEAISDNELLRFTPGVYRVELTVPAILSDGDYTAGVWVGTMQDNFILEPSVVSFTLHGGDKDRPDRILAMNLPFKVSALPEPLPATMTGHQDVVTER